MRVPLVHLLVRSPLPQIGELMARVRVCSEQVPTLIEALIQDDRGAIDRLAKDTSVLEGEADEVKNRIRAALPIRLMLPVDRRDVLRLVSEVDAIADCAEDVGVLLTLRPLVVPEELEDLLREFVARVMVTVQTAEGVVGTIERLQASNFGGNAADEALALVDELGRREHEADKIQDQCAKVLFRAEDQMSPVGIFMWTKVLNKIGDMANHAENVGDQFRLFISR